MAFPTSPTDGQIFEDYEYSTSSGAWIKRDKSNLFGNLISKRISLNGTTSSTGINVNGYSSGGSILAMYSHNYGAGDATKSGIYLIRLGYDGDNFSSYYISGTQDIITWSVNGSILMATAPAGNTIIDFIIN